MYSILEEFINYQFPIINTPIKQYDLFIFDWDGCIADTLSLWLDIYQKTFKSFGVNISHKEIVEKCFGDWSGPAKFGLDNDQTAQAMLKAWDDRLLEVNLNPQARSTLKKFKSIGRKMVLATSSKKRSVLPVIKHHNLESYFEFVLDADNVVNHKPNPEIINISLSRTNISKECAVIVGDSEKDIQAGQNAGIDQILYFPQKHETIYDKAAFLKTNPTRVIEDLKEVI